MYEILLHVHSYLRWVVLALAVVVLVKAVLGICSKAAFTEGDRKLGLFFMISCHVQLLIGLVS